MDIKPPKCPSCSVSGKDHIIATESTEKSHGGDAWFHIVSCSACGHVYGVFPKIVYTRDVTPPPKYIPV